MGVFFFRFGVIVCSTLDSIEENVSIGLMNETTLKYLCRGMREKRYGME